MRLAALTLIGSLAVVSVAAVAAPVIPAAPAPAAATLVQASWGCAPAYHPNARGNCVPDHYYYRAYYRPYYRFYYDWGQPYWNPRHH